MLYTDKKLEKRPRKFYSEDLDISQWESLEMELENLLQMPIQSATDLVMMKEKFSELQLLIENEASWRYINMTRYADDESYEQLFQDYYANVVSKTEPYGFKLSKKFYDSQYRSDLSAERYAHLNRLVSNEIELFREENIPLKVKEQELASKYGSMIAKMTVEFQGEEKTLQQMSSHYYDQDREIREKAWRLVMGEITQNEEAFNALFDEMKEIRIQMAKNAGFDNYRDYMHQEKGRFSYTPQDLYLFHEAVEKEIVPFLKGLNAKRKDKLGVDSLLPWDTKVDVDQKQLKPFAEIDEFIDKAIHVLYQVKPDFGLKLNMMKNSGFLDLDNRKGKAPGGYCTSLGESGGSFIFMNAIGVHEDVNTIVHESGHAMHSFATADEPIVKYRQTPMELAELASMSMEFLTMDYWNEYYSDPEDLKKARKEQLEGTLQFLPWCMIVDSFQQWIYTNPDHTPKEREEYFASLMDRFNTGINWEGLEREKQLRWMLQLHIFEVPFYYIEYGIAQLGALAVYKNYKADKEKAVTDYEKFLTLGYAKPRDEVYRAAGISFDFSADYIRTLVNFVREELESL